MPTFLVRRSLVLSLLALAPAAQGVKLNGPLATGVLGSVQSYPSFSPDGKWVVYQVDDSGDRRFELYARASTGKPPETKLRGAAEPYAPFAVGNTRVAFVDDGLFSILLDGSAPAVALDAPWPAQTEAMNIALVEERQRALYVADRDQPNQYELYSTALGGGARVKLNGPLAPQGGVGGYLQLSADHGQVVFLATPHDPARGELFVEPVDGSQPARALDLPLVPGGSVQFFLVTAADVVVYTADQEEDDRYELFAVPLDGSQPPRKLNGPLAPGGDVGTTYDGVVYSYAYVSPDGRLAAYTADQDGDGFAELYAVPVDGSEPAARLSQPSQGNVGIWQFTPDSARVLYLTDPEHTPGAELFSVRADGRESARRLNAPLVANGDVRFVEVSSDGRRVVYLADQDVDEQNEIFGVSVDGSAPAVKLNLPLPPGGDVYFDSNLLAGYCFVGDEIAYEADAERVGHEGLYVVPSAGGASRRLPFEDVSFLLPGPPGSALSQLFFEQGRQLFTATTAPGTRAENLHPLPVRTTGDVQAFELDPDGDRVVFSALEQAGSALDSCATDERHVRAEIGRGRLLGSTPDGSRALFAASADAGNLLYSVPSDGSTAPIAVGGQVLIAESEQPVVTLDGGSVLFRGTTSFATPAQLFSVPPDGSRPPRNLGGALTAGLGVGALRASQDGRWAAFLFGPSTASRIAVAPIDGSAPARPLLPSNRAVLPDFELAPDGRGVVYRVAAPLSSLSRDDLFWVPSDGSAAPRQLNPTIRFRGGVERFAVDWTAGRALYLADQRVDERFELFSVPLDGSAAPLRLHGELVAGGDVLDFALEPGGGSVVYRADARIDELVELFRVPVDGSRAPVRLLRRAAFVGSVSNFELTPDDARVVYRRQEADETALFSVPCDASAPPVRLSPELPGRSVTHFRISPDAQRVVYRVDLAVPAQFELFAVPVDGGTTVRVSGPLFRDGDVQSDFVIAPDSLSVFYRANPTLRNALDLFRGSTLGRQPATRINPAHSAGRTVEEFRLTPDGRTLVYRADSAAGERFELYRAASDGSDEPRVLNGPLAVLGDVHSFELSPDGKRVAYLADQRVNFLIELYTVPVVGGAALRLNPDLATGGEVFERHFTPDGRQLVFSMRTGTGQPVGLFRVAADGSTPSVLLAADPFGLSAGARPFVITRDGTHAVYAHTSGDGLLFSLSLSGDSPPVQLSVANGGPYRLADDDRSVVILEAGRLLARRVDGSGPVAVLREPGAHSFVLAFEPAGERVLLRERTQFSFALERTDLLRVPLDGSAAAEPVNSPFEPGPIAERVSYFESAGESAAYISSGPAGNRLFGVALDGGSPAVLLNETEAVEPYFLLTPDGRDIVYRAGGELRVRPVDGRQPPRTLGVGLAAGQVTPDGRHVIAFPLSAPSEVFSVSIDGSLPPLRLGEPGVPALLLLVTPDSSRALFTADTGAEYALFSAALDGSTPKVQLSPPGYSASEISCTEDGRWVVFQASAAAGPPSSDGLYGVPADGSAAATLLLPITSNLFGFAVSARADRLVYLLDGVVASLPLHGGASTPLGGGAAAFTNTFALTPDGARVVYLLNSVSVPGFLDVFSVPSDGSAPSVQISTAPVGPGTFISHFGLQFQFELTADGALFVYRASDELVAAPVDGSAPPRRLLAGLDSFLASSALYTSPDSSSAVMLLTHTDRSPVLLGVPLDASRPPRDLLGQTVANGGMGAGNLRFSADGSRFVYLGDLDVDGTPELFMSVLDRPRRGAPPPRGLR